MSNFADLRRRSTNRFQKNSTLLLINEEHNNVPKIGPVTDLNFVTLDTKFNRLLIKYCIFILFFMSLLAIGMAILKKRFKPQKKHPWSTFRIRKARRQRNIQNVNSSSQIPSIAIISSNCHQPCHLECLNYYYSEPRRLLWESFYGPISSVTPSTNYSSNCNSILSESSLVSFSTTASINDKSMATNKSMDLSIPPEPPKYEDVLASIVAVSNDKTLGLPTYEEAILIHPINLIECIS